MVAGIGLTIGVAWGLSLGPAQAAKPGTLVGHRIARYHARSAFPAPIQRVEAAALARARLTGRPVVVAAETTPTVEVVAHPDGMLQELSNMFPVRALVRGVWRTIDPRLRRTASGSWAPAVASVPVTFSGGGAGPLVTVSGPAGQGVSLYWPTALPRPAVSGSVALYRGVIAGVDLRMEATGTGYQEALVVRDAAAAADLALRALSYRVRTGGGLALRPGPGGSLGVIDSRTGKLIFVVGRPLMWDSSRTQHFDLRATADATGSGRVTPVPVSYRLAGGTAATIAMAPPATALTGKHVRYPLFIDPEISPSTDYYSQVMRVSNGFTQKWNTTTGTTSQGNGNTEIGYCGYSACIWETPSGPAVGYVDRDYFRFDITAVEHRTVSLVAFDDEQTANSDGCTYQRTDLYSTTGGIDSSTSWGGPQGSKIASELSNRGGGSSCPAGNVHFASSASGNGGLLSYLQTAANNGDSTVTLELRADSETNDLQYKLFKDNPTLSVTYN